MSEFYVDVHYQRDDNNVGSPTISGLPPLALNRLARSWRPILDLGESPFAPLRLQMTAPTNDWLSDPAGTQWPWFSFIAPAGYRRHIVRQSGLLDYDCSSPEELPQDLWTDRWRVLCESTQNFDDLDLRRKTLAIFQLAQLSLIGTAIRLVGPVEPDGTTEQDQYASVVARIISAYPGGGRLSLPVFERLADTSESPYVRLLGCFQAISRGVRGGESSGAAIAARMEHVGLKVAAQCDEDDWLASLLRSRLHRAIALMRVRAKDMSGTISELDGAWELSERVYGCGSSCRDILARENQLIITEARVKAACLSPSARSLLDLPALCEQLSGFDPNCIFNRRLVGDGFAAMGDWATAAYWYERAGELGTSAGAVAWIRAAHCHERMDDSWAVMNAMGRCLEIDPSAVIAQEAFQKAS